MSRGDRAQQRWTHRRLGLGATTAVDAALARTDALLAAVGARRPGTAEGVADSFDAALFEFVCELDLVAGVAGIDATPIPIAALRAEAGPSRRRRLLGWRVLVPATGAGVAAVAVMSLLLVAGGTTAGGPALSATAESRQLLTHANLLLTAASAATPTERTKLVAQARADLTHVSRLLPLAPATARPAIRSQLQLLDRRVQPLAPSPRPAATGNGAGRVPGNRDVTSSGRPGTSTPQGSSGGDTTSAPAQLRRPPRRPAFSGGGNDRTAGSNPRPDATGQLSGGETTTDPATPPRTTSGTRGPRPSGDAPRSGPTRQPPPG